MNIWNPATGIHRMDATAHELLAQRHPRGRHDPEQGRRRRLFLRRMDGNQRRVCAAQSVNKIPRPHEAPKTRSRNRGWRGSRAGHSLGARFSPAVVAICALAPASPAPAADWPTHMGNNQRTGVTAEQLDNSSLAPRWAFKSPVRPQPAWHRQMRYDGSNAANGEKSQRAYDSAFNLIAVGAEVFIASSAEYAVICLNAATGTEKWRSVIEGPVRIAPTIAKGRIYFGADDGRVYCLDAATGAELWRYSPTNSTDAIIPHNLDFVSLTACRTGVLVQNGKAYAGFGVVPWEAAYLCCLDADHRRRGLQKDVQYLESGRHRHRRR